MSEENVEVARRVCAERSDVAVVLTSTRDALDYGVRLGSCGARGFVSKDELSAEALADVLASGAESGSSDKA